MSGNIAARNSAEMKAHIANENPHNQYAKQSELIQLRAQVVSMMGTQDYSEKASELAESDNIIYETLPPSVMALIPPDMMKGINDKEGYPLFTPRAGIEYTLSIVTYRHALGFEQTLTIIENSDDKQDSNLTFKRSGRSLADATTWTSMIGLAPNQDLVVDTIYFRNDVRAVSM